MIAVQLTAARVYQGTFPVANFARIVTVGISYDKRRVRSDRTMVRRAVCMTAWQSCTPGFGHVMISWM